MKLKRLEERLTRQYKYCQECDPSMTDETAPSWLIYQGMLTAVETLGLTWERLEDGTHIIYK